MRVTMDEDRDLQEFQRRWDREFGPHLSARRKWLTAAFFFVAFFGLIALAFLAAPR